MPINQLPGVQELRRLAAFGTGVGIAICGDDLHVTVTRVRPRGVSVPGCATISRFTARPAAEWGSVCTKFIQRMGASHVSATVLLPRDQVIVRQVVLAGVKAADMEGAIRFQIDTLHPYGEDDVVWGWSPIGGHAALVGIMRREALDHYAALFAEAGVAVGSFTFSAAAIHAALKLNSSPVPDAFVAVSRAGGEAVEVYGQSPTRPVYSAQFDLPAERAAALAASELRLPPEIVPVTLGQVLPRPRVNPVENDLARNALPYATALAGACPRLAPAANLLPPERRISNSRALFIPSAVLAGALVLAAGAMLGQPAFENRRYLKRLQAEIARLEPMERKAAALDRQIDALRARTRLLDSFRGHTRADLEAINELTRLLPPPVWTSTLDLTRETVMLAGEAAQASGLIRIIDASPLFQNSQFSVVSRSQTAELFRITTTREGQR